MSNDDPFAAPPERGVFANRTLWFFGSSSSLQMALEFVCRVSDEAKQPMVWRRAERLWKTTTGDDRMGRGFACATEWQSDVRVCFLPIASGSKSVAAVDAVRTVLERNITSRADVMLISSGE